jgi:hypothetical protein
MSGSLMVALVQLDQEALPGLITPILAEAGATVTIHEDGQELTSADGLILLGSGAGIADDPRAAGIVATVKARQGRHVLRIGVRSVLEGWLGLVRSGSTD